MENFNRIFTGSYPGVASDKNNSESNMGLKNDDITGDVFSSKQAIHENIMEKEFK
jgi:hypothetical protein